MICARICKPEEIKPLREYYRLEMDCQIIHDSLHSRPGWSVEYALDLDGSLAGYGSVAVGGPWTKRNALYEFYVKQDCRCLIFEFFEVLLESAKGGESLGELPAACRATMIETQTNDQLLSVMLHSFGRNICAEAILFKDGFETMLIPEGAAFRASRASDVTELTTLELDDTAGWLVTLDGRIAGAGGVLYHYNRPYGDIYMKIAEPFRGRRLGAYLVQELKKACRSAGSVPAARCNIDNLASRRTLQKAGFVPCANLIVGDTLNRI